MLAFPAMADEFIWYAAPISYWLALVIFISTVLIYFLINMFLFIPLGQATGEEMDKHQPVPAYIVNIAASLAGIWLFSVLSFLQTQPVIWFTIAVCGIAIYFFLRRGLTWSNSILYLIIIVIIFTFDRGATWSPYQRLSLTEINVPLVNEEPVTVGYILNVQHIFYQRALNLSPDFVDRLQAKVPGLELHSIAESNNLPYRLVPKGSEVLIVGSGLGNDVAAALRNDMGRITAVEIDPVILHFGNDLHPESPYDDPRVSQFVDDARSFFEKDSEEYDLIAFGLLDSQTLLSSWSSVRLDSFVYTIESFEQVRKHLREGGIAVVTFGSQNHWIIEKLGRMMHEVFGRGQVWIHEGTMGTTLIAGSNLGQGFVEEDISPWIPDPQYEDLPIPTDDWPYLYMRDRIVPNVYWIAIFAIGVVTLVLIARNFPESLKPDWHFWLLGVAFLLIEFIGITRLALLFGTTWFVNALAISGVLVMILCANLIVHFRQYINVRIIYVLLISSLILLFFFPLDIFNQFPPFWRAVWSVLLLSLPLLFSGMIFSESMRQAGNASGPLASNLSGSVFGGILEYSVLWWGIQNLYIIGIIVYGLAFLTYLRKRS
jgi:SAM-dependent methyltransferase